MNRKIAFISVLTSIVVVLLLMMTQKEPPPKILTAEDEMPDFKFELIKGGFIQREDMDTSKFTLLSFFNTNCDLCVKKTQALVDSISLLDNCQILMVSYEDKTTIAQFAERFRLLDFPAIHVAHIPEDYMYKMFKIYIIPTLYVYHPDGRMIKYKPGPVTIQEIVQYLEL